MNMYDIRHRENSNILNTNMYVGETIEEKVRRIMEDGETIENEGLEAIYTTRGQGVLPETNIRTDRWDLATEAMDIATKAKIAQREDKENKAKLAEEAKKNMRIEGDGKPSGIAE